MMGEKREPIVTTYERTKSWLRVMIVVCAVLVVVTLCALRGNFVLQQERARTVAGVTNAAGSGK